jgi:hypothetical protein
MRTNLLSKSCMVFSAGVSLAILALAGPARGGDLAVKAPAGDRGEFRGFVEGGAFWTGGDPIPYNAPGFNNVAFGGGGLVFFPFPGGGADVPLLGGTQR